MDVPELLAPAGGLDALLAALAAGADAVYTGLGAMSARAASRGLAPTELEQACALAHARGARVYVALNALLSDAELADALALARRALAAGADALIVADLGFLRLLARELPEAELHLSTQAGVQGPEAALLAARELGCARVTAARELSVAELATVCATGVPIEVFCHGAICVCYSGACAFSALRRGRSANQGDCTQPCRTTYTLVDRAHGVLAGGPRGLGCGGDRLLCPRDYLGVAHVAELAQAGVASLKIEGRMKNPDYVYHVVRCYREALDAVAEGRPYEAAELEQRLARSFNRGFSDAYLRGARGPGLGDPLMSWERACNQGAYAGRLVSQHRDEAVVALACDVGAGDTLEIRSTPGEHAFPGVPKRWPQVPVREGASAGEQLRVHCKRRVEPGSAVHLVRSAAVLAESEAAVRALRGELDARGDASQRKAGGCEVVCGGSRVHAGAVGMRAAGHVDGRADGFGAARAAARPGARTAERPTACSTARSAAADAPASAAGRPAARALATGATLYPAASPEAACRALAGSPAEGWPAESSALAGDEPVVGVFAWRLEEPGAHESWGPLLPELTLILDEVHRADDGSRARRLCGQARAVVCRNLGQLDFVRATGVPWEAAAPLNVWNAEAARWLAGLGCRRIWLPDELPEAEVAALAQAVAGAVPLGRMAGPRRQLMVTEHCLLTAEGPCTGSCGGCERRAAARAGDRFLVEADGTRLPVEVDALGRTRIFLED